MTVELTDRSPLAPLLATDPLMSTGVSGLIERLGDNAVVHVDDPDKPSAVIAWGPRRAARFFAKSLDSTISFAKQFRGDGGHLLIGSLSADVADALRTNLPRASETEQFCYYVLDPSTPFPESADHTIVPLTQVDVPAVVDSWPYKKSRAGSYEYISQMIRVGPSAAIRDESGEPISFAALADHGAMGFMFTAPQHRGKGLARSITIGLANMVRSTGNLPFAFVAPDNQPSQLLLEGLGFRKHATCRWVSCFEDVKQQTDSQDSRPSVPTTNRATRNE
jgi:GNAT superfamily N-acetyltransferase